MERSIDQIIREAQKQGKFDNLPGKGKPQSLNVNDGTPEEWKLAYTMLKNGGFVPQEVEWMNEIDTLKEQLKNTTDAEERTRLIRTIQNLQLKVNLALDRMRQG